MKTSPRNSGNRKAGSLVRRGGRMASRQPPSDHVTLNSPTNHKEVDMKQLTGLLIILFFLMVALAGTNVSAQTKKKSEKKMPSQEEMMKRWQEAMTPGEPHKMLEESVGTWDAEVKAWMNGPNGEPLISKGTSEQKMVLGGRYLQQDFTGDMIEQPLAGTGFTGYDNFKKKYVSFWIDNMGTGMSTMEGTMDKDGKAVTMWGKMDEPMTGEKDKKVKYVTRFVDKDTQVFEVYDVKTYGEKKPTMQITYKRRK